jgi:hypothetical protein
MVKPLPLQSSPNLRPAQPTSVTTGTRPPRAPPPPRPEPRPDNVGSGPGRSSLTRASPGVYLLTKNGRFL